MDRHGGTCLFPDYRADGGRVDIVQKDEARLRRTAGGRLEPRAEDELRPQPNCAPGLAGAILTIAMHTNSARSVAHLGARQRRLSGAVVLLLLSAGALAGCTRTAAQPADPPPPQVAVTEVAAREVAEWDEFTGRLEAVDTGGGIVANHLVQAAVDDLGDSLDGQRGLCEIGREDDPRTVTRRGRDGRILQLG